MYVCRNIFSQLWNWKFQVLLIPAKFEGLPFCQVTFFLLLLFIFFFFFSKFNRRHHCRRCGRVVCGTCSQQNHVVEGYGRNPVRVCGVCHEYFFTNRCVNSENKRQDPFLIASYHGKIWFILHKVTKSFLVCGDILRKLVLTPVRGLV